MDDLFDEPVEVHGPIEDDLFSEIYLKSKKKSLFVGQFDPFKDERVNESDEDLKLFINDNQEELESDKENETNREIIKGILNEAKRKLKIEQMIEAKRSRQQERIHQYYFSRMYIFVQIGRWLKITENDFGYLNQLIIAQMLTLIMGNRRPKSKLNLEALNIRELMKEFNRTFMFMLDYELNWEVRSSVAVSSRIARGEPKSLNRIEYIWLLNTLLRHFQYKTRFLWAIETKSLEEMGFIKITRHSSYLQNLKKSEHNFWNEKLGKKKDISNLVMPEKRAKRGQEITIIKRVPPPMKSWNDKGVNEVMSRLDKFSFNPNKLQTVEESKEEDNSDKKSEVVQICNDASTLDYHFSKSKKDENSTLASKFS